MTQTASNLIDQGKKSLDTLLREKAYDEVAQKLKEACVDIDDVSESDIEALVSARVEEMMGGIKGFAVGAGVALLISSIVGF